MQTYIWYSQLIKPDWAPPSWLFAPVWTLLYGLIAVTFFWVFKNVFSKKLPVKVSYPFVLNLFFNFLFTPLQFGLRSNFLAAIDILLVLITLIWAFKTIWKYNKLIVYFNIPYLLWVSFATFLQLTILSLNR